MNDAIPWPAVLDLFDEPAIVVSAGRIRASNRAARTLFGERIDGSDLRLAIRNPRALELMSSPRPVDDEVVGIGRGDLDRVWHVSVRHQASGERLVRFTDRSDGVNAERMRTDFVANASHELRTPLATIIGYGETLGDSEPLDEGLRRQFGRVIHDEARRMLRLVEELMALSRIEADRFRAPSDRVDMRAVLARVLPQFVRRPDVSLVEDVATDGTVVLGDEAQLEQLLCNLIQNAVRYGANEDGIAHVRIAISSVAGDLKLTVADSGQGIDPEHLPRLTERFYRVDAARSREGGGTGLGLAIVKHIVERHRGQLSIESEKGVGTRVTMRLPRA